MFMDNGKRKNNVKGNKRERANKGGRPVKEATEKLKYRVTVKMATEDYYLLKSKAKSAGVSASEFIRGCITEGGVKERLSKEHGDLIRKLCGYGEQLEPTGTESECGRVRLRVYSLPHTDD